ncbi:hypothetical protein ES703_19477 [subsurface metagenome]
MRHKEEILSDIQQNIAAAPESTRPMLHHEYCVVEVLIDIRDQLSALTTILGSVEKIAYRAG